MTEIKPRLDSRKGSLMNAVATLDAWPRAIAFFKQYLNGQTSSANTPAK
jgi:hypothetical protein